MEWNEVVIVKMMGCQAIVRTTTSLHLLLRDFPLPSPFLTPFAQATLGMQHQRSRLNTAEVGVIT